jgi:anti-sigma B factor antagonist
MANESMTVRDNADAKIIDVNEDLGSYTAADLRKTIDGLISGASQQIIVNLSEVQHINSTAIGAMVGAAKRLHQSNGDLKVYGLADNLKRTFDLGVPPAFLKSMIRRVVHSPRSKLRFKY